MKKQLWFALAAGTLGLAILGGCDREVAHTSETEIHDGKVKTKEKSITQTPEGGLIEKKTETESEPVRP